MIDDVEIIRAAIPLTPTSPRQMWTREWSNQLFVKVSASGRTGWGEVLPAGGNTRDPYIGVLKRLKEGVVGYDEADYEGLWDLMRKITFTGGMGSRREPSRGSISPSGISRAGGRARASAQCSAEARRSAGTPRSRDMIVLRRWKRPSVTCASRVTAR